MNKAPLIYDKAMHEARKYWRDRIDTISIAGHIALDHPRPKDGPQNIAVLEWPLDPAVHALLRRLSGGNPFLAYTALVSALKISCFRYSGESLVTIFSPAMSGETANLLPIGSTLNGAAFKDTLLSTKELLSNAFKYQQYPWSRLLLDLPDGRRPKHLPMIAAMSGFNEEMPDQPADISVVFETADDQTKAVVRYDARVHDEPTVRHFLEFFGGILQQGLANPSMRIPDLSVEDRQSCLSGQTELPVLHRLFEAQAAKQPQAVAVVDGETVTTYEALDRDANDLARTLGKLSLDPKRPVVILMDAGAAMIASMLAVLKIGLAFAPVKLLSNTTGSISSVLEALDPQCILCQPEQVSDIQPFTNAPHIIPVGGGQTLLSVRGQAEVPVLHNEIACVLSGTSVTHAELSALFQWLNQRCAIGPNDRVLLSPGLGASEQLYDTLGILCAGGSVEIIDSASVRDLSVLAERLLSPSITVWDLPTPLALNLLPEFLTRRPQNGPRNILLSGEKQGSALLSRCFPNAQITGLYAAPSTGIWSTYLDGNEAQAIPPFEHRVLNQNGESVAPYTKGALYVRDRNTGLRAKALGNGRMAWLRGDDHCFVKYGCTVELTAIESILCEHEHIRAAELIAVKGERVAAFILADPEQLSAEAVTDHLVLRGDVDLIPDRFVLLNEFPLTAEGAIDREALIARYMTTRAAAGDARNVAVEEIHSKLKPIWLEILDVEDVADDDSFFARGGNSLKATLLIARIRDEFSVDLSVQKFFREPSTRAVAELIAAESANAGGAPHEPEFKIVPRERYRVQLPETEG